MQRGERSFAQVAIPSPLKEPLTYAVPPPLRDPLNIGMRVSVPLGKRKVIGVVVDFAAQPPPKKLKDILAVVDDHPILDATLLKLCRWAAQYYLSSIGEVLMTLLPPALRAETRRVILAQPGEFGFSSDLDKRIFIEVQNKKHPVMVKSLARKFPGGTLYRALDRLVAMGAVILREQPTKQKKAHPGAAWVDGENLAPDFRKLSLTTEQQSALGVVQDRLSKRGFEAFLIFGVTGSGKTELYLRAMEQAQRAGRRSLVLVPEISLTPQLLRRLRERFQKKVGVLHSALTAAERWAQWWRIARGNVDVVIGARSAVFAPIQDLGLIVVDEEHDPSYKQEDGLRYHARDLAVVRAKLTGCPVLLGSATPAVETFENCLQGRYRILELTQRVEQKPFPRVEIVDLRAERSKPESQPVGLFSPRLIAALQENHVRGQQSLIFLNRRGFFNFLHCRLCGFVLRCSHCSVTLTFHAKQQAVFCHHCGFSKRVFDICPGCGNSTLTGVGYGTEQVEQELSRIIPGARIARMDRDSTTKRGSQERLVQAWEDGKIDVLVGTQMVTKGHDVAGVTLVGVILADLSLSVPDFRAGERTFQLLAQVAGRAGRGKEPGEVIIQTYTPDHYAFRYVLSHDYRGFFTSEKEFRRVLNYPPFSRLVHLRLEGPNAEEVQSQAKLLGNRLRAKHTRDSRAFGKIEILGPAPSPIEKLRGRFRWQILLKGERSQPLLEFAEHARSILPRSRLTRLYIDVDPYNML